MSLGELAWLLIAIFFGIGAIAFGYAMYKLGQMLGGVADDLHAMTEQTVTMMGGLNETVAGINVELARVDTIVAGVQSMTATADSLVGVVHTAVSNPLIKLVAYASGAARGFRKLRG